MISLVARSVGYLRHYRCTVYKTHGFNVLWAEFSTSIDSGSRVEPPQQRDFDHYAKACC